MALYNPIPTHYNIPNYDHEPNHEDKHKRFMEVLNHHSENQGHSIPEWELLPFRKENFRLKCICSHPIQNNFFISNNTTKTTLVIGSDCMKRFLNPTLRCEDCSGYMNNVVKRIEDDDMICRDCKRKRRKIVKDYEYKVFRVPGPYEGRSFKSVAEDLQYAEAILNEPREKWGYKWMWWGYHEEFIKYFTALYQVADREE